MEKIAFIECGYYHTVFITGECSICYVSFKELKFMEKIAFIEYGYYHTVFITEIPIKSACCGANHTFLLSMDESKILAFGSNEKGQLGMSVEVEYVTIPTEIDMEKMFEGYQLKLVACGAMHTAFVTDNGLLYTCGESRHNKLCLEDIDDADNSNEVPNQYRPKRVTAMNGHIVDNVACGGCHTLLTATKGSNADFTNNDFSIVNEETRQVSLTELPPLQKVPSMKSEEVSIDVVNSNNEPANANGNVDEDAGSMDSLEANVSGSHIVNINDLDEHGMTPDVIDTHTDETRSFLAPIKTEVTNAVETMNTMAQKVQEKMDSAVADLEHKVNEKAEMVSDVGHKVNEKVEVVEDVLKKTMAVGPNILDGHKKALDKAKELKVLDIPGKELDISNSPPPKTPILAELLHIPDLSHISPALSKRSDDGQKSENGQSENETIPCESDKSSPHAGKTKTQAVMPIVRSEDHIDSHEEENEGVVVKEQGRFARIFQTIKDKEHSCIGKGKDIHKGIEGAEQTVHKVEETVETEIRNQTNSRTCTIL
ncbi:putative X-linked retinitis pigmentosa GTPase regulator [Operophtera brumata]|uniref:Putative X-linked retinitis pigmentosa GTPase regulator n=1 Tax=Operophtera brumata TaxID=104452 RepID=A0A0L7LDW3_OPEBR|nr:putative X-linked retinitis pigmentosa GTPase regulator [Operophtera brumata]